MIPESLFGCEQMDAAHPIPLHWRGISKKRAPILFLSDLHVLLENHINPLLPVMTTSQCTFRGEPLRSSGVTLEEEVPLRRVFQHVYWGFPPWNMWLGDSGGVRFLSRSSPSQSPEWGEWVINHPRRSSCHSSSVPRPEGGREGGRDRHGSIIIIIIVLSVSQHNSIWLNFPNWITTLGGLQILYSMPTS